ncbi:MAG: DUF4160 domain-containing protein [Pseudomonadota bacterium]
MPTISTFMGITIRMYFGDHPPPHIHALYQGHEALIDFQQRKLLRGSLPRRVEKLIMDWIKLHDDAILSNWRRAQALEPLEKIPGLDND